MQEEVVESEGPVLENSLTYKMRHEVVYGLDGKGEGGREGTRNGKGYGSAATTSSRHRPLPECVEKRKG